MSHPYYMNTALAMGLVLGSFGLNAMFRPHAHLQNLGFKAQTDSEAKKLNLALMRIWGVRNIAVGAITAILWQYGDELLMARGLMAAILLPIVDGFVSRELIGGGEAQHWAVPPVMGVTIAGLLGYLG